MAQMTAQDIVNIIRAGHDSKVASLQLAGLKVTYLSIEQVSSPEYQVIQQNHKPDETANQQSLLPKHDDELERSLLMVSDPVAFEESLLNEKEDG